MKWYHEADPAWLEERRKYLTKSDIRSMIPFTPTGRPRNVDDAVYKVWASKQAEIIFDEDAVSRGTMARGHILEEYALAEYNANVALGLAPGPPLFFWDNSVIWRRGCSFSPDALSEIKGNNSTSYVAAEMDAEFMGEIKSYSTEKHYLLAATDKMKLEERWEIATAMFVMEQLKQGALILYNPRCKNKLFMHIYTRADLETELLQIELTVSKYRLMVDPGKSFKAQELEATLSESEIIAKLEKEAMGSTLNP